MTDGLVVQDPIVNMQDLGAPPGQGMKAKDQENKKARLVEWTSSLTLKDVVLRKVAVDVETLEVHK